MAEAFDPKFTPRLPRTVHSRYTDELTERLEMPSLAIPVRSNNESRVGVWFGRRINNAGEFGILAVAIKPSELRVTANSGEWYYGVSHINALADSTNPVEEIVDYATARAEHLGKAVVNLLERLPATTFTHHRSMPREILDRCQAVQLQVSQQ